MKLEDLKIQNNEAMDADTVYFIEGQGVDLADEVGRLRSCFPWTPRLVCRGETDW